MFMIKYCYKVNRVWINLFLKYKKYKFVCKFIILWFQLSIVMKLNKQLIYMFTSEFLENLLKYNVQIETKYRFSISIKNKYVSNSRAYSHLQYKHLISI